MPSNPEHTQSFIVCEWWSFPLPYRYLHQHSNQQLVKRGGNNNMHGFSTFLPHQIHIKRGGLEEEGWSIPMTFRLDPCLLYEILNG